MKAIFTVPLLGAFFALPALGAFFALSARGDIPADLTRPTPGLVRLESIGYQEVCGPTTDGRTGCLTGTPYRTWIPEAVGQLTASFSNESFSCGFDEVGLKCWKQPSASPKIDGVAQPEAFRRFLNSAARDSIRLSQWSACAVNATSKALECLVPDWRYPANRFFQIVPKVHIVAVGVADSMICWADGDSVSSAVSCQTNSRPTASPGAPTSTNVLEIADLSELVVGSNWVCARSKTEGRCWNSRTKSIASLPADLVAAKQWAAASDALCALTKDRRYICAEPVNGTLLPNGSGYSIPSEYRTANPDVEEIWSSNSDTCVRLTDGQVKCWVWWNGTTYPVRFSRPVTKLFGQSSQACGQLDNGQAECRASYYSTQTLSSRDRVRVEFGAYNKCFWNSTGVDCRGITDAPSYRSVTSVSASRDADAICIVGVPSAATTSADAAQCFSTDLSLRHPPFELRSPTLAATNGAGACAVSDDGLTCWGARYAETPPPTNVSSVTKIQLAERHACLLDQFGFACWGELATLDLAIPRGLDQPARVVDFALGTSRTCVILDTGSIECWGRDYELSGAPPETTTATSVIGRAGLFCALDATGTHCWGGQTTLPK